MTIKEDILNKVFINRTESNQINQDLCEQAIDLFSEKIGKKIEGFDFGEYLEPDEDLDERYYGIHLTNMLKELKKELEVK